MADLYRLARFRLEELGIHHISGGHFCAACESRFYSYRRDNGHTGRMASVIIVAAGVGRRGARGYGGRDEL